MNIFKKIFISLFSIFFFFLFSFASHAQEGLVISPHIIDAKADPKDILEYKIKLKNNLEKKLEVYAILNDLSKEEGAQEYNYAKLNKESSLAKWISIKRGQIEINPGEEIEVPLKIKVNLNAKPGKYYASIAFASGGNKNEAEKNAKESNEERLLINLEVRDQSVEKAQVNLFKTTKNIFIKRSVDFKVLIQNVGNVPIVPQGFIRVYNKRGEEAGTIAFNANKEKIEAEKKKEFSVNWSDNKMTGKYKAKLDLNYGLKKDKELQDIYYFTVLPWQRLLFLIVLILIIIIVLTIVIFKKTYKHHAYHHDLEQTEPVQKKGEHILDLKNR